MLMVFSCLFISVAGFFPYQLALLLAPNNFYFFFFFFYVLKTV